jgi:uncharacterized protein (DUF4415 family)
MNDMIMENPDSKHWAKSTAVSWSSTSLGAEPLVASSQRERLIRVKKDASKQKCAGAAEQRKVDWTAFDALTDADIEASIRDDPDVAPELEPDWFASATLIMPKPKEQISIRLDRDVLEHFRRYPRYQTRINAILRAAMEHEKKAG